VVVEEKDGNRHDRSVPSFAPTEKGTLVPTTVGYVFLVLDDDILRQALDGSPDGVVIVDRDGSIRYVNHAVSRITGFSAADLIGQPVETLVPASARNEHVRHRNGYTTSPRTRPMGQGLTLTARHAHGHEVPVEISLSPVSTDDGTFTIASVRDISERLATDRRHQATREMLTLSAERERIARDLHDTVLQRLFGLGLEMQAVGLNAPDPVAHRLETAVDEIDQIIKEIRTSVFTLGAAKREGSLGQEIGDIIAQSARMLGFSPRLRIEGPVENMVTPVTRGDLVAALREALANVARHSEATAVTVEILLHDDELLVRVVDNGVGYSPERSSEAGNGLSNLAARAAVHGGEFRIGKSDNGGTTLEWSIRIS